MHIFNVHAREAIRHQSLLAPVAAGIVVGLGITGYALAIRGLVQLSTRVPALSGRGQ